jgi:hypothetical protein
MDSRITVDLRALRKVHFRGLPREQIRLPSISPKKGPEVEVLKKTLSSGGSSSNNSSFLSKPIEVATKKTKVSWLPSPDEIANSSSGIFTAAIGLGGSAGAGFGPLKGGGVYGSDSGEIGLYGTSNGWILMANVGASVGVQFTLMKGAPNVYFAGDALGFAIDIGPPSKIVSGGGILYVDVVKYLAGQFCPCGIGFNISVGWSLIPVTFSVQYSYTNMKPLFLIK